MNDLRDSRILITGGAGLVGSHIADRLAREDVAEVIILDNFVRGRMENLEQAERTLRRLTVIHGDITDPATCARAMEGVDYVFHQAALRITQCAEMPRLALDSLVGGTFNILEAAVNTGVRKVVAASSASVYGEPSYLPMDEGHPFNNRTLYGACKVADEQVLRSFNDMYGLPYVALRYFNIYGPRMDAWGVYTEVMIRWLQRLERNEAPVIFGDGMQTMDFVYIEDVAEANVLALKSDVSDDVFNVATGEETSLRQLARMMCDAAGKPHMEPTFEPPRKVNPVTRRKAAVGHARDRIGFAASWRLEDGLRELVRWHAALEKKELAAVR
ncbi:MAG: NAD-dependent epimerase/dehydratase family protein [Dehalococcoidia bacterium]|nr:NAD-dependent epimerase/dehydratase family protein [Dehalococcoidia bacterium]